VIPVRVTGLCGSNVSSVCLFQLEAGDIILSINEREVLRLSTKEVLKCLRLSGDIVHIKFKRGEVTLCTPL